MNYNVQEKHRIMKSTIKMTIEKRKKQAQRIGKKVNWLHILALDHVKIISVKVQCYVKVR